MRTSNPDKHGNDENGFERNRREQIARGLRRIFDDEQGGFGRQKYPFPRLLEALMIRGEAGDKTDELRAKMTLAGQLQLVDPVDGGMYQYSVGGVWNRPHFERIAAIQAGAIATFSLAYRLYEDPQYIEAAKAVAGYVLGTLQAPSGGFYASQDADLGTHSGPQMKGELYFSLGRAERKQAGTPHIDEHVYTHLNGLLIAALVELYMAQPKPEFLEAANRAADHILQTRISRKGLLRHAAEPDSRYYLSDQVQMARALVGLYQASGDANRLGQTQSLVKAMRKELWDDRAGGFFSRTADPADRGIFAERKKPQAENAIASQVLLALGRLGVTEDGVKTARHVLSVVATDEVIESEGRYVGELWVSLEKLTRPYAIASVVGPRDSKATEQLLVSALYWPFLNRYVERGFPGRSRYPYPGRPAVYVCDENACSAPSFDPESFTLSANLFVGDR